MQGAANDPTHRSSADQDHGGRRRQPGVATSGERAAAGRVRSAGSETGDDAIMLATQSSAPACDLDIADAGKSPAREVAQLLAFEKHVDRGLIPVGGRPTSP